MGGLSRQARLERSAVLASLALVAALAWLWLWRAGMSAMDAMDMPDMAAPSRAAGIALAAGMWVVMMTGMMLPSAAPTIVFYGALVRKNAERGNILPALWIFTSGYLAVWAGFSLAAALLQAALEQAMLLTPALASASPGLSAAVLIAAGLYQWSPVKQRCLQKCRNPIEFFAMHWHAGQSGALRMGARHGLYCLGCCWMLMLLLFVAGVMNLLWVALIAAFVFVEKILPAHRYTSRFAGLALLAAGAIVPFTA